MIKQDKKLIHFAQLSITNQKSYLRQMLAPGIGKIAFMTIMDEYIRMSDDTVPSNIWISLYTSLIDMIDHLMKHQNNLEYARVTKFIKHIADTEKKSEKENNPDDLLNQLS